MARQLRQQGWWVTGWGQGRNQGRVGKVLRALLERVDRVHEERGPLSLVGWSMGGILARELARRRPEAIDLVVTLGSPIQGGLRYTAFHRLTSRAGREEVATAMSQREARPVPVPLEIVLGRRDGVVSWTAGVDPRCPGERHHVLDMGHFELIWSSESITLVQELLQLHASRVRA